MAMRRRQPATACILCGTPSPKAVLAEAGWLAPEALERLAREHPGWRRRDGACPNCVQWALLRTLLERGDVALHEGIQKVWPLDAEAAFGALPTPLRMHADPRYSGRGVTMALVDAAFYPHPDLTRPTNRIRAWVDAGQETPRAEFFTPRQSPRWPGWDGGAPHQWHGLMTSAVASGSGRLSQGLYRGLASDAELVLVQVRDERGRITNQSLARALGWLRRNGRGLGVRLVSLSVGGDPVSRLTGNPVDEAVAALTAEGMTVVAAAGNEGERRLIPPATAPEALTIGGLDDRNTLDHAAVALWHSNYGEASAGARKPELVAPSLWVVAPILPGTEKASEARRLFLARARGSQGGEARIAELKLVTPHYHHVDGTSVAAPLVASVVACMLQANPGLTPALVRKVLRASARPVPGAPLERQGAGALDAGQAVARAKRERHGSLLGRDLSPQVTTGRVAFLFHDHDVRQVHVLGSWDGWRSPGLQASLQEPGVWWAELPRPAPGRYVYKLLLDGVRWLDDPENPLKEPDGHGRLNSLLMV